MEVVPNIEEKEQEEVIATDEAKDVNDTEVFSEENVQISEEPEPPVMRKNIPRIAKFEKVSFEEFCRIYKPLYIENQKAILQMNGQEVDDDVFAYNEAEFIEVAASLYDNISLPVRSTMGSAGYDFKFPFGRTELVPGGTVTVPTGIKCFIEEGWVLMEFPRSSLGFNYRIQLDNTVGIIDSDYYNNTRNEGHIMIKITNDSRSGQTCIFEQGSRFCQGIFLPFGITLDDDVVEERTGGLGSTGK